ncbi:rCG27612 [Rattus norvegicus]|uniref:RCG27612 n=1 Tax=Rattus norvegicus TaxID=10116 RepID=A6KBK4_RAT|nr:rCG27612 [Rattus norvegicus]
MDRDQGHTPDPRVSAVHQSVGGSLYSRGGQDPESWVQHVCPRGSVQGVPVAVEAERDTAADEDHLPPIPMADKSFHAPGRDQGWKSMSWKDPRRKQARIPPDLD